MKDLGITKGFGIVSQHTPKTFRVGTDMHYRNYIAEFHSDDCISNRCTVQEAEANANLFSEALTVANETGKTPRQLEAQNARLLEALRTAEAFTYAIENHREDTPFQPTRSIIEKAIKSAG